MSERRIPDPIKRIVRKEGYFGCCKCGNPIIEYHHIIPWAVVKEHKTENLMTLCPRCHHEATCGHIDEKMARKYKEVPFNKNKPFVTEVFLLRSFDKTRILLGGNSFENVLHILSCGPENLISVRRGSENETLLSAKFYDERNNLIAEIVDNEWKAYFQDDIWDIQYAPGHLKINQSSRKIFLDLEVKGNEVLITGRMYVYGNSIKMLKNSLEINGKNVNVSLVNCRIVNFEKGIILDSFGTSAMIGV